MTTDVEIYKDIVTHKYLHILATTFLYWDHIITFGRERECIWSQARTFTAQLFFLNRYLAFSANMVVIIMGFTDLNHSACHSYYLYRQISLVVTQVIVCILLTMRLYALYSCSKRILCYMMCSGVILISVSCWALFSQEHVEHDSTDHWSGCQSGLDRETATRVASPWEALFVYDTILFALTVIKTRQNQQSDIVALLLRDGAIYFAVMALANLMNILTFYLAREFLRGSLSSFASCVSVTMMSRLMLNLHATSRFQSVGTSTWMTFGRDLEYTHAETDTRSMGEDEIEIEDDLDAHSTSGERMQIRLHL